ncbi:MAG: YbaK/EbsC family protein, partial [Ktedonobacterales bacterium]
MPKKRAPKTNAMRALEARGIAYDTFTYPETIHSAEEVATLLGVPAGDVYKTLVVLADGESHLLVVTPGDRELDPRLVARAVGAKSARMASQRDAECLTGLKVGGNSPLALLEKRFEVYVDATAEQRESRYINGGQRGVNPRLRVSDLPAVTGARFTCGYQRAVARASKRPHGALRALRSCGGSARRMA